MDFQLPIGGNVSRGVRLLANVALGLFFLAVIGFSCYYPLTDYAHLAQWYKSLGPCFYRSGSFTQDYFTETVKSKGNIYCMAALPLAVTGLYFSLRKIKSVIATPLVTYEIALSTTTLGLSAALTMACYCLWHWGNALSAPAYDEVFSALNVAGIHPFQGASYYMLPNNHLLFNLINNFVAPLFTDGVRSGRLLSLFFYTAFALVVFKALINLLQNNWLAFLASVAIISQFFVWGFSFQARGYELYLLCECGLFISLLAYISTGSKRWLMLNNCYIALGYFCMPSFLYLHATQLLFLFLYQLLYKKWQLAAWAAQASGFALAFMLYLPALCFSGYNAIGNNPYVAPMGHYKTYTDFCAWMFPYFKPYVAHIFADIAWNSISFNISLCLLPLAMLFSGRRSKYFLFGLFYAALLIAFFVLVIAMKRLSFERNLIGHYSIVVAFSLITLHWLLSFLKPSMPLIKNILFSVTSLLLIYHFLTTNTTYLKDTLYEYDVNSVYHDLENKLQIIPLTGDAIAYSPESFYCRYILEKRGFKTNKCTTGNERYFLKQAYETLPEQYKEGYALAYKVNDCEIYKRVK